MTVYGSRPLPTPPSTPRKKQKTSQKKKQARINDSAVMATFYATKKVTTKNKGLRNGVGKKKEKINPKFAKKVRQVIDNQDYTGKVITYHAGGWDTTIPANQQGYKTFAEIMGSGSGQFHFTAPEILTAARALFFEGFNYAYPKKIAATVKPPEFGIDPAANPSSGSGYEFRVVNSWVKVDIKNNTARTFKVRLHNCAPKMTGTPGDSTFDSGSNPVANSLSIVKDPLLVYDNAIEDAKRNGLLNNSYARTDYNNSMWELSGTAKVYSHETTEIIIGPGQTENYYIQGPKNYDWKWSAHYKMTQFMPIQKYSRCVVVNVLTEPLTDGVDNAKHGVPPYTIPVTDPKLEFRSETFIQVTMPEQTFTSVTGNLQSTTDTTATARRDKVLLKFQYYDAVGEGVTTLPNNPIQDSRPDS